MCKKFIKYRVEVIYRNGETERFNLKGYNEYSYKSMMQLYNFVKKKFLNEECKINFIGIMSNGEEKVMFLKENKQKKPEFQLQAEKYTNTTMVELMERLQETLELIEKRGKWLSDEIKVLDKMQDIELHKIESYSNDLGETVIKDVFDEIKRIRKNKRFLKEDRRCYEEYTKAIEMLDKNKLKNIEIYRKEQDQKEYKYPDERLLKDKKIFTKSYYNNETDREILKKSLSKKYDVVIVRDNLRVIIAYNKARC